MEKVYMKKMIINQLDLGYNPKSYWNSREHPNTAENPGISQIEANYLLPKIASANSILEVGPGVGRLFSLYSSARISNISTVDISTNYRDRALLAASSAGVHVKDFYLEDPLDNLPFGEATFDVGIAIHMLMHVPFENINHSMSELARCCKRVVVISAINKSWPRKGINHDKKWHCFAHDYKAICIELGCFYFDYTELSQGERDSAFGFQFSLDLHNL
jgi:2-polyprenyl-3-methyl-5-hydroxy-6-metoxy-1,4-benzoquinol methylase